MDNIQQTLKQYGQEWDRAIELNDTILIGQFMAEEWVIVGTDGGITSKEDFLAFIRSGDLIHTKMDFEEMHIKVYGDIGIVTSRGTSSGTYKDQPFSLYEWSTNVYVRKGGEWLCVHTMLTPAKKM